MALNTTPSRVPRKAVLRFLMTLVAMLCTHGLMAQQGGTIRGVKYNDLNGNGTRDGLPVEPGLEGWTIRAVKQIDTSTVFAVTNAQGEYTLNLLTDGTYTVAEIAQNGWLQTAPQLGHYVVPVSGGADVPGRDFGNISTSTLGKVSGMKFHDLNHNSAKDVGEVGLPGWNITLTLATPPATVYTQMTGADGSYLFTNLIPGDYTINESAQADWEQTLAPASPFGVPAASNLTGFDFGNFHLVGEVRGKKFLDFNGNQVRDPADPTIANWTIELRDAGLNILQTTTTNALGEYVFSNLVSGSYVITEVVQTGWVQTTPLSPSNYPVTVDVTHKTFLNKDFGNRGTGSISGKKFADALGTCDPAQSGLPDWEITLHYSSDSAAITALTATTGPSGLYSFTNLPPGDYYINETIKPGYHRSCPPGNGSIHVTLAAAQSAAGINFGNQAEPASISGRKLIRMETTLLDTAVIQEELAHGWTIKLTQPDNSEKTMQTGPDGEYSFTNLTQTGTYIVSEIQKPGFEQVLPGSPSTYSVLIDGEHRTYSGLDFVNRGTGEIDGKKFDDALGNCDPSQAGLLNWQITLKSELPLPPLQIVRYTDQNGLYSFTHLVPGNYTIEETPKPLYWTQTCPPSVSYTGVAVVAAAPPVTNKDFGNHTNTSSLDLSVSVAGGRARPGRTKYYSIRYENKGTVPANPRVTFIFPGGVTYTSGSSTPPEDARSGNQLTWDVTIGTIPVGYVGSITVPVEVPPSAQVGDLLTSSVQIVPLAGTDVYTPDNEDTETQTVRASFDPNEKIVSPAGLGPDGIIDRNQTLTYQIDFQNTGTDTAFNIVLQDTLDPGLDYSTFETGASSHPYTVSINLLGEVEWIFENIMLPDSSENEPLSHGFVKFSIHPKTNIATGSQIENLAGIYFDFNDPIFTNTTLNTIGDSTKYRSWSPDSIVALVKGKLPKPTKRGKGLPNIGNVLSDMVAQGGFAPLESESDDAGGMRIGISYVFEKTDNKWVPDRDSAKRYAWVRLTKWDFNKEIGKNFADIQKTLRDRTGLHTGAARGLDSSFSHGIPKKLLLGQKTVLAPSTQNNHLFAELVALKVNIVASGMEITPLGFGDLTYHDPNPLDGELVSDIADSADDLMTHWRGRTRDEFRLYDTVISKINRAFLGGIGPADTISFTASGGLLQLKGVKSPTFLTFLSPGKNPPKRIRRNTSAKGEDGEDDLPKTFALRQSYPNPFNPAATIEFDLPRDAYVTLQVYDILGRKVATLSDNELEGAGTHRMVFNARNSASGVYFYRLTAVGGTEHFSQVKKMLLVR